MPQKIIEVAGIGPVEVFKRRGARSIRVSLTPQGAVRLTLPFFTPLTVGMAFLHTKTDWIVQNKVSSAAALLQPDMMIGKAHRLNYRTTTTESITTRISGSQILVSHPVRLSWQDERVQAKARQACIRALRKQAEVLLPKRLSRLAEKHNFTYRSVAIKQLTRRWGSCDQHKNIVCNLFLMTLPWELIDYVLIHELTHTKFLNHSAEFWAHVALYIPNVTAVRKQMKQYQARI